MKFGSFILTYNRPEHLQRTIGIMLDQTTPPDLLLVVDNGNSEEAASIVQEVADGRVVYQATGENLGSAGGVAYGMEWLYHRGFDWMHSVDDDNPPPTQDTVQRLQELIARNDDGKLGAVAAFGTRWNWKTGEYDRLPDSALHGDVRVDTLGGNSHLTVRKEVIAQIGTPEKAFFFGFYDPLYCLRMAQAGWFLMVDGDLMRISREQANRLDLQRHRSVVPSDPYTAIWRRYYVSRNYIYRMRRTFDRPDLARRETGKALLRSATSWARGPRYGAHYTHLQMKGVLDGYAGRLGRRVEPQPKYQPANEG